MYEIIIGRDGEDKKRFGDSGTFLLGRHYVKMGQTTSLSNNIYMDVARSHVVFVAGKRGSGKCLHGDTLIPLNDGSLIPIRELEQTDNEIFSLDNELKISPTIRQNFYKRTVDKMLHITLRSGKEIKLTPEHPLLTILGWKEAQELTAGSRIATSRIVPCFGKEDMPESDIKLLAYLIAEGHTKQGVLFSNADQALISDFTESVAGFDANAEVVELAHGQFRLYTRKARKLIQSHIVRDSKGRISAGSSVEFEKTKIRLFLEKHKIFGKLAVEKEIPAAIMKLKKGGLALFLNRLFSCDGSIYKSRKGSARIWEVSYASSSRSLIEQVRHLLLRFGILSKLRNKKIRCNNKEFSSFELIFRAENLLKFIEQIGFFGVKEERQKQAKKEVVIIKRNPNVDTIPREFWDTYKPKSWAFVGKQMGYAYPKSLRESQRYAPSRQKLLQISKIDKSEAARVLAESDIFWDEVIDIKEISGSCEVYDITVPEFHNFVANDIIVHNSYSLGVIAEGMMSVPESKNLSVVIFDTMGIYWTMKYENKKDADLLREWQMKPKSFDVKIYTPKGFYEEFRAKGIPTDAPFSLRTSELSPFDWCKTFEVSINEPVGVLVGKIVNKMKKAGTNFAIKDIINELAQEKLAEPHIRDATINLFTQADSWGLFDENGTSFADIAMPGQIAVIDVSAYSATGGNNLIRALVIGIVCQKIFASRMIMRKKEEYDEVHSTVGFIGERYEKPKEQPLVWIMVDEAHEFLPKTGITAATSSLITLLREGRQPGISMVLATQQPGQIHTDVLTQSDIIIAHLLTAKADIDALGTLMQSYMREGLDKAVSDLPRVKGSGIVFDDINERMYVMRIRPRITWHGGGSPTPFERKKTLFEL